MPRPRPVVDGVELVPGLTLDPRKRPGVYSLRLPDGRRRVLRAATPTQANLQAQEELSLYGAPVQSDTHPVFHSWEHLIRDYLIHREDSDPSLVRKESWRNRRYALEAFPEVAGVTPSRLEVGDLVEWWDGLTRHQQDLRRAEFRRMVNWGMLRGWFPRLRVNPFDLLETKAKPPSGRSRLTLDGFNLVYQEALDRRYVGLSLAMKISLLTTLRRGDICNLTADSLVDGKLRVVVSKSHNKLGDARASRLEWDLKVHKDLGRVLNECSELSLRNGRCPYLISHRWRQRRRGFLKDHIYRLMPDKVTEQFRECAKAALEPEEGKRLPTFHEIRSLSAALLRRQGVSQSDIKELMAHTDETTTVGYQHGHEYPYRTVETQLQLSSRTPTSRYR